VTISEQVFTRVLGGIRRTTAAPFSPLLTISKKLKKKISKNCRRIHICGQVVQQMLLQEPAHHPRRTCGRKCRPETICDGNFVRGRTPASRVLPAIAGRHRSRKHRGRTPRCRMSLAVCALKLQRSQVRMSVGNRRCGNRVAYVVSMRAREVGVSFKYFIHPETGDATHSEKQHYLSQIELGRRLGKHFLQQEGRVTSNERECHPCITCRVSGAFPVNTSSPTISLKK